MKTIYSNYWKDILSEKEAKESILERDEGIQEKDIQEKDIQEEINNTDEINYLDARTSLDIQTYVNLYPTNLHFHSRFNSRYS